MPGTSVRRAEISPPVQDSARATFSPVRWRSAATAAWKRGRLVGAEDGVPEAGANLRFRLVQAPARGGLAGVRRGQAQRDEAVMHLRRHLRVVVFGHQVEEPLADRGFAQAEDVQRPHERGAVGGGAQLRLDRFAEHHFHLGGHAGHAEEAAPAEPDGESRRGAGRVAEHLAAAREIGLDEVGRGRAERGRAANISRIRRVLSGSSTSSTPHTAAKHSRVGSSRVGPRPPVTRARSARGAISSIAARMSARRSPTVVCRTTSKPSNWSCSERNAAFVSAMRPAINSLPIESTSAFMLSALCRGPPGIARAGIPAL